MTEQDWFHYLRTSFTPPQGKAKAHLEGKLEQVQQRGKLLWAGESVCLLSWTPVLSVSDTGPERRLLAVGTAGSVFALLPRCLRSTMPVVPISRVSRPELTSNSSKVFSWAETAESKMGGMKLSQQ